MADEILKEDESLESDVNVAGGSADEPYITVKRDGEDVNLSLAEATKLAQKGIGADAKFREASAIRDEAKTLQEAAKEGLALKEAMMAAIQDEDEEAFQKAGTILGLSKDEIKEAGLVAFKGTEVPKEKVAPVEEKRGPVSYNDLSPDIQRVLRIQERQRITSALDKALDSDEFMAYTLKEATPERRTAIRGMVEKSLRGRLQTSGGDFGDDGSQVLKDVLAETKEVIQALGTPEPTTPMGLGGAPGAGGYGGPPKEPDYVSSQDAAFEEHILDTLRHNESKAHG